ncbi:MAG: aspartate ammonia-lyase [bacterium]
MKKLYQGETAKAIANFQISGQPVNLMLINAVATVKKAAALANFQTERFDKKIYNAIKFAADQIIQGKYPEQFVTDQVQGGAGTSTNMNVNEVISSLAVEYLKGKVIIHPNDHVNLGQSTNDVIPTAIKVMLLRQIDELISAMKLLEKEFQRKSIAYKDIVKVGRTHLQDAVPITLGQSFGAYATFMKRNIQRFEENKKYLYQTNLGGTALGSAINSSQSYLKFANAELAKLTGYPFKPAPDLFDATQNSDDFLHIANILKTFTAGLSKICNDLRMLASGPRAGLGELILPEVQKGSSIMPGKVNPVILELMNQICYQVFGNVETAFHAALNSQFELNAMLPIYAKNMNEAFILMTNGLKTLTEKAIKGLKPNEKKIQELFDNSLCTATALNRYLGYDQTAKLVKNAVKNQTQLIDELKKEKLLDEAALKKILQAKALTEPSDEFLSHRN